MDKKRILWIVLGCAAVGLILTVLLLSGPESGGDTPGTAGTTVSATGMPESTGAEAIPTGTTQPSEAVQPEQTEQTEAEESEPERTEPQYTEPERTEPKYTEPERTEPPVYETVLLPVEIDGGLVVQSIFQFTGMNPDADNRFGENIAGIQITNTSDEHMTAAEITAVLADGTTLTFTAGDIPAGGTILAFCLEHEALPDTDMCEEVFGWAEFEDGDPLRRDLVSVAVSGTNVTVKNVSGRDLTDLRVICRSMLDDSGFGGITYSYHVQLLPAGKSTVVNAVDCFLGMTEVVRVDHGG